MVGWRRKSKVPSFLENATMPARKLCFQIWLFCFGFSFLVHRECNFMNVLILGSDHIKLNSEPVVVDINHWYADWYCRVPLLFNKGSHCRVCLFSIQVMEVLALVITGNGVCGKKCSFELQIESYVFRIQLALQGWVACFAATAKRRTGTRRSWGKVGPR